MPEPQTYVPAHFTGGAPAHAEAPTTEAAPTPTPQAQPAQAEAPTPPATQPTAPTAPAMALVPGTTAEAPTPAPAPEPTVLTPPVTIMTGQPETPPPTKITTTITGEPVAPPKEEKPKAPEVDWKGIAMKQGAEIALTSTGVPAGVATLIMPKLLDNNAITFDTNGNVTIDTVEVEKAIATLRSAYGSSIPTETKNKMNPHHGAPVESGPKNWRETLRSAFS